MIPAMRFLSRILPSRRSVESKEPTSEPVAEIWSANSTIRRSMIEELTLPRPAIDCEISLISSSVISAKSLAATSSPSDSSRIEALSLPVSVL